MNKLIILNKMNTLYLTPENTYVISKIFNGYEISRIDDVSEIIGWSSSLTDSIDVINDWENGAKELILC